MIMESEMLAPGYKTSVLNFIPRESNYLIKLLKPAEKSAGGIWLPESAQENWVDGIVVGRGPGYKCSTIRGGFSSVMWAEVYDRVLFPKHHWQPLSKDFREGLVRDEHLVAVIRQGESDPEPLNSYVLVEREMHQEETQGGLAIPSDQQSRPRCGKILDWGPGKIRLKGDYFGTRMSVCALMGWPSPEEDFHKGWKAYWDEGAEVVEVGEDSVQYTFVKAEDLVAVQQDKTLRTTSDWVSRVEEKYNARG